MSTALGNTTGTTGGGVLGTGGLGTGDGFLAATGFGPGSIIIALIGGTLTLSGAIMRRLAHHPTTD